MNVRLVWFLGFCVIALIFAHFYVDQTTRNRDASREVILNLQSTSLKLSDSKSLGISPFIENQRLLNYLENTKNVPSIGSGKSLTVILADPNSSLYSILKIDIFSAEDIRVNIFVRGAGIYPIEISPKKQMVIGTIVNDMTFEFPSDISDKAIADGVSTKIILQGNQGALMKYSYGDIPVEVSYLFKVLDINPRSILLSSIEQ